ncbi:MAG: glycosyltransferase family 4 protein [Saprospiraceae bacterium]|nr:glycosyltransferase family 4 protein [Saprospiraceae bacterium]
MESIVKSVNDINTNRTNGTTKSKMKILWFTTSPSLSRGRLDGEFNVGTSWIEAMEELINQQEDIELAIAFTWRTNTIDSFTIDESRTRYFAMPRRPQNKWINLARQFLCLPEPESAVDDCLTVVQQFKPDIVHFFGTETLFPLVIPKLDMPHIIWFQGNLTVYQKKWHAGISVWQSFRTEKIKDVLLGRTDLHFYLLYNKFVARETRIFNQAKNFIGRTAWDRRLVSTMAPNAQYFHCDEIMRPIFYRHVWKPNPIQDKYILVSTFRDNLYKGLETAMQAFKILTDLTDRPIEWRIIGVPEHSHYEKVCRKVSGLGSTPDFKIMGLKSASEIINIFSDATLFVHPSHIDNSPNSVCEAMLYGIPVVATNVGGIPSIVKDNTEGLLVQNGDEYALAGAILQMLKNPNVAMEMAVKARKRAMLRNDGETIIADLRKIYQQLIFQPAIIKNQLIG